MVESPDKPNNARAAHANVAHAIFAFVVAAWTAFGFGVISSPPTPGEGHDEFVMIYGHINVVNYQKAGLPLASSPLATSMRKPHLPFLASAFVHGLHPAGYASLLGANFLFALAWIVAVYLLAARVFDSWIALVGVCVLLGFHLTHDLAEHFGNDIPVALFATLVVALLADARGFDRPWRWPVLGVLVGLGLLAKPTLPVYVAGPALLLAWRVGSLFATSGRRAYLVASIGGLLAAVAILVAVWLPWFARVFDVIGLHVDDVVSGPGRDFALFHTIDGDTAPADLAKYLGFAGAAVVAFGTGAIAWRWRGIERRTLLAAYLPPLLIFVVVAEAFTRILFPLWFIPVLFAVERLRLIANRRAGIVASAALAATFLALGAANHAGVTPRIWPARDASNPAYAGAATAKIVAGAARRPGDALYVNLVPEDAGPRFYFDILETQAVAAVPYVHVWDARQKDVGNSIVDDLVARWDEVRYLIVRRPASEPPVSPDADIANALARSRELLLPGDRARIVLESMPCPAWAFAGSLVNPPGGAGMRIDVFAAP
ncbi:MAG: glycosyltransferase family 39 protein [Deltaproteobacteria bacterium]|nr:glycosyltransferase family 39 protein [Deltaproteobacteria bacterium]